MIYYGQLMDWPLWADVISKLNHFMLAVNASINIIIYVIKVNHRTKTDVNGNQPHAALSLKSAWLSIFKPKKDGLQELVKRVGTLTLKPDMGLYFVSHAKILDNVSLMYLYKREFCKN